MCLIATIFVVALSAPSLQVFLRAEAGNHVECGRSTLIGRSVGVGAFSVHNRGGGFQSFLTIYFIVCSSQDSLLFSLHHMLMLSRRLIACSVLRASARSTQRARACAYMCVWCVRVWLAPGSKFCASNYNYSPAPPSSKSITSNHEHAPLRRHKQSHGEAQTQCDSDVTALTTHFLLAQGTSDENPVWGWQCSTLNFRVARTARVFGRSGSDVRVLSDEVWLDRVWGKILCCNSLKLYSLFTKPVQQPNAWCMMLKLLSRLFLFKDWKQGLMSFVEGHDLQGQNEPISYSHLPQ